MTAPLLGRRVRALLPADLVASLRAAGVDRFVTGAGEVWEWSSFKTRYVRTAAGARRYGLPIGSPIVGKGRKPSSGGSRGGARPGPPPPPGGGSGGGGGARGAAGGDGNRVRPTPAQRDAADLHFGRDPGNERGAYLDGNRVVVEDREKALATLDRVLADPSLTPGERKSRKNLRDKIANAEQAEPTLTPEPTPEPEAPDVPDTPDAADTPGSPDDRPLRPPTPEGVRDAYWDLARERAAPVRLSELRKRMSGTREEQDRALTEMSLDDDIFLRGETDQQHLTDEDRAAAIRLGNEDRHNLQIDADPPSGNPAQHPATPAGARQAYWDLATGRGDPVKISDLRKRMGGTRAEQDRVLRGMAEDDGVHLREEANQQNLTQEHRDGAVMLGGLNRHNIQLDEDPPAG